MVSKTAASVQQAPLIGGRGQICFDTLYPIFIKIGLWNGAVAAVAFIISLLAASLFMAVSVAMGTVIGIINLSMLARSVKSGFLFNPEKAQRFITKRYYARLALIILVAGVLVSKQYADPAGLIAGFSIILLSTLLAAIYFAKKELA